VKSAERDPTESSNTLAASWVMVLLLSRTVPLLIHIFICVLVDQCVKLLASSTELTPFWNLRNHPRTCTLHLLFSLQRFESHCIIFLQFKLTFDDYMLLLQIINSVGTGIPNFPIDGPALVLNMAPSAALLGG
jgi:hypothetical protein